MMFAQNIKKLEYLFNKTDFTENKAFYKFVEECIQQKQKKIIITANPEAFMLALKYDNFYQINKKEEVIIIPDGIGLIKAAKLFGINTNGRNTGVELTSFIFKNNSRHKNKVLIYGSSKYTLNNLEMFFKSNHCTNIEYILYDGYTNDMDKIVDVAIKFKPDIVIAALGMPKQEIFLDLLATRLNHGVLLGVGGALDVISGVKRRSPKIFLKYNLEWLYRILKEPKRFPRFIKYNIPFILYVCVIALKLNFKKQSINE